MVNCRICNSQYKELLFKKYGFDIVKCGICGLIYSDFHPTQQFLKKYYSKTYFVGGQKKLAYDDYGAEEGSSRLTARKRISYLKLGHTGKVLDVGCAYGFFLAEMPEIWDKYGVEISKFACLKAMNVNPKAKIKNSIFSPDIFQGHRFDLITFWDVIEHLDDPGKIMSVAYKKLKKGGVLALSTGDAESIFSKLQGAGWHLYTPPQHLSFFSPTTIKKLLRSVGFKKISTSHPSAYYPVSYVAHKLSSVYGIKLPDMRALQNLVIPINLGDIMLITATK